MLVGDGSGTGVHVDDQVPSVQDQIHYSAFPEVGAKRTRSVVCGWGKNLYLQFLLG